MHASADTAVKNCYVLTMLRAILAACLYNSTATDGGGIGGDGTNNPNSSYGATSIKAEMTDT